MLDISDNGERQVAPTIDGIRADHVARYRFAAERLPSGSRVIDLACGVGYGAMILAASGHSVLAIDRSEKAIAYAKANYPHPRICYVVADAMAPNLKADGFDAAVCFETIEHLEDPEPMLKALRTAAPLIIASVPNEDRFPFRCDANGHRGWAHHHRHYRREELRALLAKVGYRADAWYGQAGPESDVESGIEGRTLVVEASRAEPADETVETAPEPVAAPAVVTTPAPPEHVAILGLGPSLDVFTDITKRMGGRHAYCDEVWGINAAGAIFHCDRVFHMDDLKVQELRAARLPNSNIAAMVEWLRTYPGPVYTSAVRPGYPGLVEFPLAAVINKGGLPYFNSTAAYAVAFARFLGVKILSPFGLDYTLPNIHHGERGRACVEFWLGMCAAGGMEIRAPDKTTLLDAIAPDQERFYGFDCFDIEIEMREGGGGVTVTRTEKPPPSAEEVEERYDHTAHTNRIIRGDH